MTITIRLTVPVLERLLEADPNAMMELSASFWRGWSKDFNMPLEYCCICGGETGRAGRSEDSIYREVRKTQDDLFRDGQQVCSSTDDEAGPLCEDCNAEMARLGFFREEHDDVS